MSNSWSTIIYLMKKICLRVNFTNTLAQTFTPFVNEISIAACRLLLKLTSGVDFTNIFQESFLYLQFMFVIFWKMEIDKKAT